MESRYPPPHGPCPWHTEHATLYTIVSATRPPGDGSPGALIEENEQVTLQIEVSDVGDDDLDVQVDWGDGSTPDWVHLMPAAGSAQVVTVYHTYGFLPTGTLSELYNIEVTMRYISRFHKNRYWVSMPRG